MEPLRYTATALELRLARAFGRNLASSDYFTSVLRRCKDEVCRSLAMAVQVEGKAIAP